MKKLERPIGNISQVVVSMCLPSPTRTRTKEYIGFQSRY